MGTYSLLGIICHRHVVLHHVGTPNRSEVHEGILRIESSNNLVTGGTVGEDLVNVESNRFITVNMALSHSPFCRRIASL